MALVHPPLAPSLKPAIFGVGPSNGMPSPLGCSSGKDSRWLTLEVCREYARNKCTRGEDECRFAHPPPNVEVQNGRVMCCFDSIKGRCQRTEPPCKYLHPPQHLKEQLLQNGRNNLLLRNLQCWPTMSPATSIHPIVPTVYPIPHGGFVLQSAAGGGAAYTPFFPGPALNGLLPSLIAPIDQSTPPCSTSGLMPQALTPPEQNTQTSACHNSDIVPLDGAQTSCASTGGDCSYWQAVTAPLPTTAAYVLDSHTGTTYYTPTGYFQGVSTPSGLLMKAPSGGQQGTTAVTTKDGLTLYTPCAPPPPPAYQPIALQSCYPLPMVTHPMGHTGQPVATGPIQRY